MLDDLVGILLPVYKKDNPIHFKIAINSLLTQTYDKLIIYIGCDGSLSRELDAIISEYMNDCRLKIIRFSQNRGLAMVLNDLIHEARKDNVEYLARMDADDISLPDRIKKQLIFLKENPDNDVVGGAIEEIDSDGNSKNKIIRYPLTHSDCRKFFRYRDPLAHPATFFRMSFFDKAKGYRNEYRKNQDTILWFDGFQNGCVFSNIQEVVLKFRVNETFYDRRNGIKRAKQMLKDRIKINKSLNYDLSANLFAIAMFIMTISPQFLKKLLYKIR